METRSTCPYCGTGCGVLIEHEGSGADARITGVRGDPDHPANFGRLCSKGSTLHQTALPLVRREARLLRPEVRIARDGPREPAAWGETLDYLATRFADTIARHGPDSVGFYVSGQLLTEEYYVFNKLAKGLIGTNNIDSNSRLCMSSAVAGYKKSLGADAPPACYEDIDHADLIFIAGSNTAWAHPIVYRRIEAARQKNPNLKVIVADPRRTETAAEADLFLPLLPGTDVALFNGLLHICIWEDWVDAAFIRDHTEGYEELKRAVREYTPEMVARTCGLTRESLYQAAHWFGAARGALSLWCQGLNQSSSGTAKNCALINLHLATGQIGKKGAGPFSLTGQPNAMGGREVGAMANLLPGHRDLRDPADRAELAALWGVDALPAAPGRTAVEMFEALRTGEIRLLWIACTNPAQSLPDQANVRAALRKAELVVLQECFAGTATAQYADVVLPAATWGEKDGTVTNSERRISRVRGVLAPPGQARPDADIVVDFARRLEARLRPGAPSLFPFGDVESIWNEHRATTVGRDLDIGGLSWRALEEQGPQQWPYPVGAEAGRARLYTASTAGAARRFATPDGRARFIVTPYQPVAEAVDARYPLRLTTGRLRDQWHGMSRSGLVAQLFAHAAEPVLQMATEDMERRGLAAGDLVHASSRRGTQVLPVEASAALRPGQAFAAMHWGSEFVSGNGVNAVTLPAVDPVSFQPELKHAAIKVVKAGLPWRMMVFGWLPSQRQARAQAALRACFGRFGWATAVPFGREDRQGLLFRAASDAPADAEVLRGIEAEFGLGASPAEELRYDDARRGVARHIRIAEGKLQAVSLIGDTSAAVWLRDYLEQGLPVAALGRLLLMPGNRAPTGFKARGKVVCGCFDVAASEITATLAGLEGTGLERLPALQQRLKCGTNCGSCLPELKRLCVEPVQLAHLASAA